MPVQRPSSPRAFRHRNYRLFWSGQAVSLVGTWMQSVAQAWLVLTLTNDPFMLGLLSAAQWAPVLIFGVFGGVFADALPKRRVLVVTQAVQMTLAFTLGTLAWTGLVQEWHVLVLALLLGCTSVIDIPTRQAFVYEMVGRDDLPNAVALNTAAFNASRIVGPAMAGLAVAAFGAPVAFLVNGLSFLGVIGSLFMMRAAELQPASLAPMPHSVGAVFVSLREGLAYIRTTPGVLLPLLVLGIVSTVAMNFQVVIPPLARDVLQAGPQGFGFLMAATGFGALLAAVLMATGIRPSVKSILGGAMTLGVFSLILAWSRSMPVSLVAMFITGFGGITMAMGTNTLIQVAVPNQLRGRVMSVFATIFAGTTPIGGIFQGTLAATLSTPVSIFTGGVLAILVTLTAAVASVRMGLMGRPGTPSRAIEPGLAAEPRHPAEPGLAPEADPATRAAMAAEPSLAAEPERTER
jgi:MFS family permease